MTKWDLFQKCKGGSTEENKRYKNNINRTKEKKRYRYTSSDTEKAFNKIDHSFIKKNTQKTKNGRELP